MRPPSLHEHLGRRPTPAGPLGLILVEDAVEVASTVAHHLGLGFGELWVLVPPTLDLPTLPDETGDESGGKGGTGGRVRRLTHPTRAEGATEAAVNAVIAALPGRWLYYCYNAEYLFFPFCESRSLPEMLAFHADERRDAMLTYVLDLYAGDLAASPSGVSRTDAWLDRLGYHALARPDPFRPGAPAERQLDFFGGLRWRFEERIPPGRRTIDRIALFRTRPGLSLLPGHRLSEPEYNTVACPWHHNLTAAIASFRVAKALIANAAGGQPIARFRWPGSVRFDWNSRQLLDLGLIEPGQWF